MDRAAIGRDVSRARSAATPVVCVDVGSTWTKAALVAPDGRLLGKAQHRTTPPEVLHGVDAVRAELGAADMPALACSSAGGGLRLAVVGQEPLVSAEAGRRVALSAGARVVRVSAGNLGGAGVRALRADRPDVVLLVGGNDGGDARTLLHNARKLAVNRIRCPIVLAGNAAARDEAIALLRSTNRTVVAVDNVLPDVGELNPWPARKAIREVFLRHVIGGKGLSRGPRLRRLVRMVTPDAVLHGVTALAGTGARRPASVLVVDVGGATTDVYSAVSGHDGDGGCGPAGGAEHVAEHAAGLAPQRRTVEGDLGMRISAPGVVTEGVAEKLLDAGAAAALRAAAEYRAADPGYLPASADAPIDLAFAAMAAVIGIRRHLRTVDGQLGPSGADLLVLSGGVFRYAAQPAITELGQTLRADPVLRPVLRRAVISVDADSVLAPAGLLTDAGHAAAADALLSRFDLAPEPEPAP